MTMASHWPAGTASIAVWSAARRFSAEPSCRPMSRCRNVMMVLASAASSSSSRWKTGQAMTCNRSRFIKLFRVKLPVQFPDEFRRSAAATADEVRPGSENGRNGGHRAWQQGGVLPAVDDFFVGRTKRRQCAREPGLAREKKIIRAEAEAARLHHGGGGLTSGPRRIEHTVLDPARPLVGLQHVGVGP